MNKKAASAKQNQFLKRIEDLLPPSSSLVHELAELLQISTDSAYRRIRGETLLSIEEIIVLCNHFNISFDAFSKAEKNIVTFSYKTFENRAENLLEYLKEIYSDLTRIQSIPESHIIYACQDIPVFYHYNYSEIAAFKFFYWMRSIMNISDLEIQKYNPGLITPEIIEVAQNIFNLYSQVSSTEIWTDTTIQSTLKQIAFYWEAGVFNDKEEAISVCESLRNEISHIHGQAKKSIKLPGIGKEQEHGQKKYNLYFSEIEITNNCVLIKLGNTKAVHLSHFSFYTMKTMNDVYCSKTEEWLDSLIKKTTLISGVSEKTRHQFFNKMFRSIDGLIKKIREE